MQIKLQMGRERKSEGSHSFQLLGWRLPKEPSNMQAQ